MITRLHFSSELSPDTRAQLYSLCPVRSILVEPEPRVVSLGFPKGRALGTWSMSWLLLSSSEVEYFLSLSPCLSVCLSLGISPPFCSSFFGNFHGL